MPEEVRLDKWLWATRFFKTRSLAQRAVKGGKVDINGASAKASRLVRAGDQLRVTKGEQVFEVVVEQVGEKRVSAPIAQTMYQETEAGRQAREKRMAQRRDEGGNDPKRRPDKRDRRRLRRIARGG